MCVLFPEASLQPSVRPSVCLLLKFRGDELNSPAALRGGTGGLLIQLLHRCVHSSNTRPPHFLNTHTTTQSRAPSTSPTAQKEKENTRKNKPKKKKHWSFSAACRVRRPHPAEVRLFFWETFLSEEKKKRKKKIILRGEWEERRSCEDTIKGGSGEGLWDGVTEWRERRRGEE